MLVRTSSPSDGAVIESFLHEHGAEHVARLGQLIDARDYPALLAEREGDLLGVLTYDTAGERCEILTLHATPQWRGVGTALIEEVGRVASAEGCRELWLITTKTTSTPSGSTNGKGSDS